MEYLTTLNFYQRKILCQWRCRSNSLPVSVNRFTVSDEILCPFCHNEDFVGDELHYLLKCSFFDDDRLRYIGNISSNSDVDTILELFRQDDIDIIQGLYTTDNVNFSIY